MKDFDLFTLRIFVAVCDAGNILSISERENIVPSAITKRLTKLEQDCGVTLLNRTTKGVSPTRAGIGFLHEVRALLLQTGRLASQVKDIKAELSDTVMITSNTTISAGFLPYDVGNFLMLPENKNINVDISDGDRDLTIRSVLEGRSALGIVYDREKLKGLKAMPYRKSRLSAFCHKTHVLSKMKELTYDDVKNHDRVAVYSNLNLERQLDSKKIIKRGPTNKFRVQTPNMEMALRLVDMQVGVLIAPAEMKLFFNLPNIVAIPLTDSFLQREYVVCYREERTLQLGAKRLLKYFSNVEKLGLDWS
ncbi:MAG: LysR family transcriptional regulator [Burkholderiaceae bacterium]|nr:LysR family transcriptional regulator [Burkholderiaceae bacterium]